MPPRSANQGKPPFPATIDWRLYFRFAKSIVLEGLWPELPPPARAILPTIGIHANAQGWCNPSMERIAKLTRISVRSVHDGVKSLEDAGLLRVNRKFTSRGKRRNEYFVFLPAPNAKNVAFFHHPIIYGGNWGQCNSHAKSLYPVLRSFAFWMPESVNPDMEDLEYEDRTYDLCDAEPEVLMDAAGLTANTYELAVSSLIRTELLTIDSDKLRVNILPG